MAAMRSVNFLLWSSGLICIIFNTVISIQAQQQPVKRSSRITSSRSFGTNVKPSASNGVNFDCPEEFGYYPHPSDCTQYYVCVFGGALLESCTGGLMYSHELQTCDWPRNVGCALAEDVLPTSGGSQRSHSSGSLRSQQQQQQQQPPQHHTQQQQQNVPNRVRFGSAFSGVAAPPQLKATVPPQYHRQPQQVIQAQVQTIPSPHELRVPSNPVISSRGLAPKPLDSQEDIAQLYADAHDTLPPVEEEESDRQQRVYRGQPSTVGQVQRDRDGIIHQASINAIPSHGKIGSYAFGPQYRDNSIDRDYRRDKQLNKDQMKDVKSKETDRKKKHRRWKRNLRGLIPDTLTTSERDARSQRETKDFTETNTETKTKNSKGSKQTEGATSIETHGESVEVTEPQMVAPTETKPKNSATVIDKNTQSNTKDKATLNTTIIPNLRESVLDTKEIYPNDESSKESLKLPNSFLPLATADEILDSELREEQVNDKESMTATDNDSRDKMSDTSEDPGLDYVDGSDSAAVESTRLARQLRPLTSTRSRWLPGIGDTRDYRLTDPDPHHQSFSFGSFNPYLTPPTAKPNFNQLSPGYHPLSYQQLQESHKQKPKVLYSGYDFSLPSAPLTPQSAALETDFRPIPGSYFKDTTRPNFSKQSQLLPFLIQSLKELKEQRKKLQAENYAYFHLENLAGSTSQSPLLQYYRPQKQHSHYSQYSTVGGFYNNQVDHHTPHGAAAGLDFKPTPAYSSKLLESNFNFGNTLDVYPTAPSPSIPTTTESNYFKYNILANQKMKSYYSTAKSPEAFLQSLSTPTLTSTFSTPATNFNMVSSPDLTKNVKQVNANPAAEKFPDFSQFPLGVSYVNVSSTLPASRQTFSHVVTSTVAPTITHQRSTPKLKPFPDTIQHTATKYNSSVLSKVPEFVADLKSADLTNLSPAMMDILKYFKQTRTNGSKLGLDATTERSHWRGQRPTPIRGLPISTARRPVKGSENFLNSIPNQSHKPSLNRPVTTSTVSSNNGEYYDEEYEYENENESDGNDSDDEIHPPADMSPYMPMSETMAPPRTQMYPTAGTVTNPTTVGSVGNYKTGILDATTIRRPFLQGSNFQNYYQHIESNNNNNNYDHQNNIPSFVNFPTDIFYDLKQRLPSAQIPDSSGTRLTLPSRNSSTATRPPPPILTTPTMTPSTNSPTTSRTTTATSTLRMRYTVRPYRNRNRGQLKWKQRNNKTTGGSKAQATNNDNSNNSRNANKNNNNNSNKSYNNTSKTDFSFHSFKKRPTSSASASALGSTPNKNSDLDGGHRVESPLSSSSSSSASQANQNIFVQPPQRPTKVVIETIPSHQLSPNNHQQHQQQQQQHSHHHHQQQQQQHQPALRQQSHSPASQSSEQSSYDSYYSVYDDDIDLYRDVEYQQQQQQHRQRPQQQQQHQHQQLPSREPQEVEYQPPNQLQPQYSSQHHQQNEQQQHSIYHTQQQQLQQQQQQQQHHQGQQLDVLTTPSTQSQLPALRESTYISNNKPLSEKSRYNNQQSLVYNTDYDEDLISQIEQDNVYDNQQPSRPSTSTRNQYQSQRHVTNNRGNPKPLANDERNYYSTLTTESAVGRVAEVQRLVAPAASLTGIGAQDGDIDDDGGGGGGGGMLYSYDSSAEYLENPVVDYFATERPIYRQSSRYSSNTTIINQFPKLSETDEYNLIGAAYVRSKNKKQFDLTPSPIEATPPPPTTTTTTRQTTPITTKPTTTTPKTTTKTITKPTSSTSRTSSIKPSTVSKTRSSGINAADNSALQKTQQYATPIKKTTSELLKTPKTTPTSRKTKTTAATTTTTKPFRSQLPHSGRNNTNNNTNNNDDDDDEVGEVEEIIINIGKFKNNATKIILSNTTRTLPHLPHQMSPNSTLHENKTVPLTTLTATVAFSNRSKSHANEIHSRSNQQRLPSHSASSTITPQSRTLFTSTSTTSPPPPPPPSSRTPSTTSPTATTKPPTTSTALPTQPATAPAIIYNTSTAPNKDSPSQSQSTDTREKAHRGKLAAASLEEYRGKAKLAKHSDNWSLRNQNSELKSQDHQKKIGDHQKRRIQNFVVSEVEPQSFKPFPLSAEGVTEGVRGVQRAISSAVPSTSATNRYPRIESLLESRNLKYSLQTGSNGFSLKAQTPENLPEETSKPIYERRVTTMPTTVKTTTTRKPASTVTITTLRPSTSTTRKPAPPSPPTTAKSTTAVQSSTSAITTSSTTTTSTTTTRKPYVVPTYKIQSEERLQNFAEEEIIPTTYAPSTRPWRGRIKPFIRPQVGVVSPVIDHVTSSGSEHSVVTAEKAHSTTASTSTATSSTTTSFKPSTTTTPTSTPLLIPTSSIPARSPTTVQTVTPRSPVVKDLSKTTGNPTNRFVSPYKSLENILQEKEERFRANSIRSTTKPRYFAIPTTTPSPFAHSSNKSYKSHFLITSERPRNASISDAILATMTNVRRGNLKEGDLLSTLALVTLRPTLPPTTTLPTPTSASMTAVVTTSVFRIASRDSSNSSAQKLDNGAIRSDAARSRGRSRYTVSTFASNALDLDEYAPTTYSPKGRPISSILEPTISSRTTTILPTTLKTNTYRRKVLPQEDIMATEIEKSSVVPTQKVHEKYELFKLEQKERETKLSVGHKTFNRKPNENVATLSERNQPPHAEALVALSVDKRPQANSTESSKQPATTTTSPSTLSPTASSAATDKHLSESTDHPLKYLYSNKYRQHTAERNLADSLQNAGYITSSTGRSSKFRAAAASVLEQLQQFLDGSSDESGSESGDSQFVNDLTDRELKAAVQELRNLYATTKAPTSSATSATASRSVGALNVTATTLPPTSIAATTVRLLGKRLPTSIPSSQIYVSTSRTTPTITTAAHSTSTMQYFNKMLSTNSTPPTAQAVISRATLPASGSFLSSLLASSSPQPPNNTSSGAAKFSTRASHLLPPSPALPTSSISFPSTIQRASRVNNAIKASIAAAASAAGRTKATASALSSSSQSVTAAAVRCSDTTSNAKCNEIPSRTNSNTNRNRGGSQYIANQERELPAAPVTSNRGTHPPRTRPTLKPSGSIVSKAQEFVDIYRYPASRPDPLYPQPTPDKAAAKCRKDVCLLPDCYCGGKEIPGDMPVESVPQIVLLTFDDSVNDLNKQLYIDLFEKGRVNPNGCPITATFYVSHEWTDYSQVQNLYSDGHEMASHTISHSFGEQFSQKKWNREISGQREILAAYGGVKLSDVRGMRAPFLSVGGNKMYKMLYDSNFTYDSSMPVYENRPPSWPYTLDYKIFHDCMIPPCPTRSYPGVWQVPMVMWQDLNGGRCSMGDACSNPSEADQVTKMIMKNFERHYTTNRAPFGLFYHAAWFTQPHHKEGFIKFLDAINAMPDVWILTNWQMLQWVRDPTPISRINSFQPFQCDYSDRPKRCNNPKVCNLWHKSGVRYMKTCQPCPDIYPWTGKTGIRSSRIDNEIEETTA